MTNEEYEELFKYLGLLLMDKVTLNAVIYRPFKFSCFMDMLLKEENVVNKDRTMYLLMTYYNFINSSKYINYDNNNDNELMHV